ncbi:hypothetical protein BDCR2A_01676 [Borrelia duttonii CR2A]|uniref:Uncharacterized protein n=1 Tax=Borrelia duttonii CR2A TaxID=1432657 RepID=W6TG70_9SPIR|nr:hypothetical protein BDCR2A_01676 [Borrelia duttonii CR2A]
MSYFYWRESLLLSSKNIFKIKINPFINTYSSTNDGGDGLIIYKKEISNYI